MAYLKCLDQVGPTDVEWAERSYRVSQMPCCFTTGTRSGPSHITRRRKKLGSFKEKGFEVVPSIVTVLSARLPARLQVISESALRKRFTQTIAGAMFPSAGGRGLGS